MYGMQALYSQPSTSEDEVEEASAMDAAYGSDEVDALEDDIDAMEEQVACMLVCCAFLYWPALPWLTVSWQGPCFVSFLFYTVSCIQRLMLVHDQTHENLDKIGRFD